MLTRSLQHLVDTLAFLQRLFRHACVRVFLFRTRVFAHLRKNGEKTILKVKKKGIFRVFSGNFIVFSAEERQREVQTPCPSRGVQNIILGDPLG